MEKVILRQKGLTILDEHVYCKWGNTVSGVSWGLKLLQFVSLTWKHDPEIQRGGGGTGRCSSPEDLTFLAV